MEYWVNLVLLFFMYAFLGWCIEVTLKYIQYRRFINRGFFTGPICPIYGVGAALITVCVGGLKPLERGWGITFAVSFFLCGAVEYFTSYFMEKRFHARWWDYSQKPMNLHGRIWIGNLVLFGLGGVAIIHVLNPALLAFLGRFTPSARRTAAIVLAAVFAVDFVDTHFILKLVKAGVERSEADNTEEIRREIATLFSDKNIFYRRFCEAYPEVVYRTEQINARLEAVRVEAERLRREAEQQRERIAQALEPPVAIRSGIIEKQGRLIDMLYDESRATDEEAALKREIEGDVERLNANPLSRLTIGPGDHAGHT